MADILVDTFTDVTGVGLIRHEAETGGGWYSHWKGRQPSQPEPLINANRVRFSGFTGIWNGLYYHEDAINGSDYEVESNLVVRSNIGIVGRMDLTEPHGYALRVTSSQVAIIRFADQNPAVAGTSLGATSHGLSNGTAHKFKLSFSGSTIKAFVNDVEVLSVVDATYSAGGYVGIAWSSSSTSECLWHDFKVISGTASLVARHSGAFSDNYSASIDTNLEDHGSGDYIKVTNGTSAYIEADDDHLYFVDLDALYLVDKHIETPNQTIEFDFSLNTPPVGSSELNVWFKAGPDYILPIGTSNLFPKGYRLRLFRGGPTSGTVNISLFNIQGSDNHEIANTSFSLASGAIRHVIITFQDGLLTVEIGGVLIINADTSSDYRARLGSGGYVLLAGEVAGSGAYSWIDNLTITPESMGPTVPCSPEDPSTRPVFDEFNGSNNSSLNLHTANTGHAWISGHGVPNLRGGFLSSPPAPLVLDGNGALVNPAGMKIEGTHQLVYAPRTRNYEIGFCFTKLSGSFSSSSLYFFWRDTTEEYGPRRGSRTPGSGRGKRYELYVDSGGSLRLIKRISGDATLLDSGSAVWSEDVSNYVQIVHIDDSIEIYVNGVLELSSTDAAITEPGTISLQIYGRALITPFPKSLWKVHWFYVDDSYATVGSPNKALFFSEKLTAKESLVRENLDTDTVFFKHVPDAASVIENIDVQKDPATTKDVDILEAVQAKENISIQKLIPCGGGSPLVAEVGSFTVNTTTGNQVINHGLGETPKFIIVWCAGKSPGSFGVDVFNSLGFYDGTTNACIANTIEDAVGTSDTYDRIASNLFLMRNVSGTIVKAASITAWDSTTFTVNHASANAAAMTVCYLIVAGDSVQAKIGNFLTLNTTGGGLPASQGITGVGFKPDGLMLLQIGGVGSTFPQSFNSSILIAGMADGALNQGVIQAQDADGQAVTLNIGAQLTDAVLCDFSVISEGLARKIALSSMDADGFTLNYLNNFGSTDITLYLAIKGAALKVGAFNKVTGGAPASQVITGLGFSPEAVFLMSWQRIASAAGVRGVRFGAGGYDGTNERALAYQSEHNNTVSQANEIVKTDKAFIVCNNDTPAVDAEADGSSLDSDGFTLSWSTNNAVATEILYLALGEPSCDENAVELVDSLFAADLSEVLGDKGIALLEMARMNELHGVGGSLINKVLQISEFLQGVEILLPNQEFSLTDDFSISEAVTRVAVLLETIQATEIQDIRVALDLIDATNINDVVALYMFHAIADGASLSETIRAIRGLSETFTAGDVVAVLNLMHKSDGAAFGENLSVSKSGPVDIPGDPDAVYQVRLSIYFIV